MPLRRLFTFAVVTVLALRALVPAGFMISPSASGDGLLEITICTSSGPKIISVDENGAPVERTDRATETGWCPFGTPAVAIFDNPAAFALPADYARIRHAVPTQILLPAAISRFRLARGPPSSVSI